MKEIVRNLKMNQTRSEETFWNELRNRKFMGLKFRRQHLAWGKVLDFYCYELNLAIEIDGSVHLQKTNIKNDVVRQKMLEGKNINFYKIYSWEVEDNIKDVLEKLKSKIINFKNN